jgi:hypothetical protein
MRRCFNGFGVLPHNLVKISTLTALIDTAQATLITQTGHHPTQHSPQARVFQVEVAT